MSEHRDEVTREVRGNGSGGLHEVNGGIAQAIGDGVVTECGLEVGLASELPQRGAEAPVELANGERLVVSHPLQQLLIAPRLGARLIRSSFDSHRSRTGPMGQLALSVIEMDSSGRTTQTKGCSDSSDSTDASDCTAVRHTSVRSLRDHP